jgi:hypothetical protein
MHAIIFTNFRNFITVAPPASLIGGQKFKYLALPVEDDDNEDLISFFPDCIKFIDEALQAGGRVLVHW